MKFIENSISAKTKRRSLVHGVGINDAPYSISDTKNSKKCPYYSRWCHMLERCYSKASLAARPTYIKCIVCDDWLLFSNFKAWMVQQDWEGNHLDKDILIQGCDVYSPDSCLFVPPTVNQLVCNSRSQGKLKRGVCLHKYTKRFKATLSVDDKSLHLGYFSTEEAASSAYKSAKYERIRYIAEGQPEPLRSALLNWKILD